MYAKDQSVCLAVGQPSTESRLESLRRLASLFPTPGDKTRFAADVASIVKRRAASECQRSQRDACVSSGSGRLPPLRRTHVAFGWGHLATQARLRACYPNGHTTYVPYALSAMAPDGDEHLYLKVEPAARRVYQPSRALDASCAKPVA